MRVALTIGLFLSAWTAQAYQEMNVAVCNLGQLPATAIQQAEAEAAYVFRVMDVEIHWKDCRVEPAAADAGTPPDFIVRVRQGTRIAWAGPASLEAMGRAFMDSTGYGYMADTYFDAIHQLAARYPTASRDQLLGCVITHELGHLLIGAGHRPNGIMRASWGKQEMEMLYQRHLKFTDWERSVIRQRLQTRQTYARARAAAGLL